MTKFTTNKKNLKKERKTASDVHTKQSQQRLSYEKTGLESINLGKIT